MLKDLFERLNGAVRLNGFDDAILGTATSSTLDLVLAYDYQKMLVILMEQGMDRDGAIEFFEFNILCLYAGDKMPVFIDLL